MRAARKHRPDWDEAFFLVRTDPERKPAVRRKPSKPLRLQLVPFDFEAARRTWEALGVEITEDRIREHLAELEQGSGGGGNHRGICFIPMSDFEFLRSLKNR